MEHKFIDKFNTHDMTVIDKIEQKDFRLSDEEILDVLKINNESKDFYHLLAVSNELSRSKFKNKGYVFTQIGINAEPCSINCRFCSMGFDHYSLDSEWKKDVETLKNELIGLQKYKFDDFFLMTTADYPINRFIELSKQLKPLLKANQRFVANIGDFEIEVAK